MTQRRQDRKEERQDREENRRAIHVNETERCEKRLLMLSACTISVVSDQNAKHGGTVSVV